MTGAPARGAAVKHQALFQSFHPVSLGPDTALTSRNAQRFMCFTGSSVSLPSGEASAPANLQVTAVHARSPPVDNRVFHTP